MFQDNLAKPPFNLDRAAVEWLKETLGRLSAEDRLAQLFGGTGIGTIRSIRSAA